MMYVLFVIISLGNNNHTIFYERNLSESQCVQIADALNTDSEYKASCQLQNAEI